MLPAIVFLSLAYALRYDRHVRIELILDILPPKVKEVLNVIAYFLGFITFLAIACYSLAPAWQGWLVKEYEGVQLKIPIYPVRFICFLGSGLFSLQFLINLVSTIATLFNPKKGAMS
jgi:TRAP-type mannitol/chloroaromatic compound transport system permease small subunit